jgi:HPt (histidine-containing phosphotransfer) domain-containing protein
MGVSMDDNSGPVVYIDRDLEDLIPEYLENRQKDIEEIRKLIVEKDLDTIKRLSHNIKGSGGSFGFARISEIGTKMEQVTIEKNIIEILNFTVQLENYLKEVKVVYKDT